MRTLSLSDEQLAVINAALQEMPMRLAYPVVVEINKQLAEQHEENSDDRAPDPAWRNREA